MRNVLDGVLNDAHAVVLAGIAVLAAVSTGTTWWRTRSLVPTLGALLLGAVVLWGVSNMPVLTDRVQEDVDRYSTEGSGGGRRGDG